MMDYTKWTKPVLLHELAHRDREITNLKVKLDGANQTKDFLQERFTEETIKNKVFLEVIDHILTRR